MQRTQVFAGKSRMPLRLALASNTLCAPSSRPSSDSSASGSSRAATSET